MDLLGSIYIQTQGSFHLKNNKAIDTCEIKTNGDKFTEMVKQHWKKMRGADIIFITTLLVLVLHTD